MTALLRHHEQVCTKADLLQAVWPGMVVEENNLHVQVTTLRKLLGAAAVANVHGRGYVWTIKPDVPPTQALFGREALLAAASAVLAAPSTRLLTLHGPGGVGKTRLAQALVEQMPPLRDGHCMLALAPLTPDVDLAAAQARALGLQPNDKAAPLPLLLNVSPLPVPGFDFTPGAMPSAALRLFLQRARDVGHPLSPEHPRVLQAAAHICRQLDGLPLALELAAARLRLMTATALQEQIERSHRVVGAGSDATPGRQRSLHDTLR